VIRRPLFAANWKMHKSPAQTKDYVAQFWAGAEALTPRADIVLCAPFTDLETLRVELLPSHVKFGAQDCYWEPQGPYTGEISAAMLQTIGATYCIVGHSERRRLFGETDETVSRKVEALLALGITPIVCVGETLDEKQQDLTVTRVRSQIMGGLGALSDEQRTNVAIAYEPVWCIGSGMSDDPVTANQTIETIRKTAGGLEQARILYGGSMNADNVASFCAQPAIDGGLVGGASLDPRGFFALVLAGMKAME
jgi:triosephosphate isomerase